MHYFLLISLLLSSCFDSCQKTKINPHSELFTVDYIYDKSLQLLSINIKLKKGMHAYAAGEKIGKPVDLQIEEKNGWHVLSKPQIPLGKEKIMAGISSVVLDENFTIKQYLQAGDGETTASLFIQVCSENFCSKPQVYVFNIKN